MKKITITTINNAVKYAEASAINVNISKIEDKMLISIKDDGKGFDKDQVNLGNGINNMKKRADDVKAQLSIQSNVGQGTVISLVV